MTKRIRATLPSWASNDRARETHVSDPTRQPGLILVASNARTAVAFGTCAACRRAILPGIHRVADLPDGRGVVHLACTAGLAGVPG